MTRLKIANEIDLSQYRPKINHADYQWQIVKYAKLHGWKHQYWWRTFKSPKGWLDLVLARPPRLVMAEIKIPPDTIKPEQQEWIDMWKQYPLIECYIWLPDDWDTVVKILD
jgi:hypothetical protein